MARNYFRFENTPSKPAPNWKGDACSILIMKRVDPKPTASLDKANELICCWAPKMWTVLIGILQMVVCAIGLATVFLLGQDKLSDLLMHYFVDDDKRYFFDWIVTLLIILFSNGIFWGFLLTLGAKYENAWILTIWLIAELFSFIVSGVALIVAVHAYFLVLRNIRSRVFPPSAVLSITCILLIGQLLGQIRIWCVALFAEKCESHLFLEEEAAASELQRVELGKEP